jgi:hypothetical protein
MATRGLLDPTPGKVSRGRQQRTLAEVVDDTGRRELVKRAFRQGDGAASTSAATIRRMTFTFSDAVNPS